MNAYQHTVQYYETDRMGVTHHSNYIRWMEEARVDFLNQIGWGYDKFEQEGVISPVIAVDGKFKVSTTFADVVSITVCVEEFKGVRLKLFYEMKNAEGKVVFDGHSEHCFLNAKGAPVRMSKMYPEFCELLKGYMKPE